MSSSSNGGSHGTSQPYEARRRGGERELEMTHHEGIVKVIEVLAESSHSWEDAARNALAEAEASIRNIKSIYVKDMQAIVHRGEIVRWRLNAKISFAVEHHEQMGRSTTGEKSSRPSETQRQGGRIMERMEEGRRQFRDDREEGRERYESQEEGRYRGQGGYRASEDEGRRMGGSEGLEHQGEYGRNQNLGWRYGGEGRFSQERGDEGSRYQSGGYSGMGMGQHQGSRYGEYGGEMGRSGQYGEQMGGRSGQYGRGQWGGGSSSRFGGQETGGQYIGGQYRSGQLGGGQYGGGQYGGGQSGMYGGGQSGSMYGGGQSGGMYGGGQSGMYRGGQSGMYGQTGSRQFGGGQYGQGGQYGIERPGYFGEGGMGRSYQGEEQGYGREEGIGRQLTEFGGAMAGRVRRMFKGPKGYKRSDDRIREDVCDVLSQVEEIDPSEIEVSVANGEVTLSGSVPERSMKWQAEQIVDSVSGVNDINNQLRVKRFESSPSMGMGGQQGSTTSSTSPTQAGKGSSARS